jgi:hypothetical protein
MADFGNTEDEIPYPLPPTTVAPTTTKQTTAPPIVVQVPTSSSASDQNTSLVQKSNAVDLEDVPAMDTAGDDNLLASGVYSEYESTPVDYTDTFCNVTPVAKTEQHANPRGCPPSIAKSNGFIEMMHLQMQQQAFLYQCDQEDKAEQEKRQLEELEEEHEECCLE